jgi:hypothetical protein
MPHMKEPAQQKRPTEAMPVLGAAGLSFSMATGAFAAVGSTNADAATFALIVQPVMEEEYISDVQAA